MNDSPPFKHRGRHLRILMLLPLLPWPVNNGSAVRMFHLIRLLSQRHHLTAICLTREDRVDSVDVFRSLVPGARIVPVEHRLRGNQAWRAFVTLPSLLPFHVHEYSAPHFARTVYDLSSSNEYDLVHVCHLVMAQYLPYLRHHIPTIYDSNGSESLYWRRYVQVTRWPLRSYFLWNWWRTCRYETRMVRHFNGIVAVSHVERPLFDQLASPKTLVSTIYIAPDTSTLLDLPKASPESKIVLFTGSLHWFPNIDAVKFFCKEIWPFVLYEIPEAEFWVVGRKPATAILSLANSVERVRVFGDVPDMRPYLQKAAVFVAPIRTGSGIKLKTLEAMAAGRAVVSTSLGAEGWEVEDGEHLLRADDPAAFAKKVIALLQDPRPRQELGTSARRLVQDRYDARIMASQMERFYYAVLAQTGQE